MIRNSANVLPLILRMQARVHTKKTALLQWCKQKKHPIVLLSSRKITSHIAVSFTARYWVPIFIHALLPPTSICHYSWLSTTICHYSYYSLLTFWDYRLFATICYLGFPDTSPLDGMLVHHDMYKTCTYCIYCIYCSYCNAYIVTAKISIKQQNAI